MTPTVGSGKIDSTASRQEATLIYTGQFLDLLAKQPKPGQTVANYDNTFVVEKVVVTPEQGKKGTMTVSLVKESPEYANQAAPPLPTYEVEWAQVDRKLEQAPVFQSGGTYALDSDDLDEIDEWRNQSTASTRATKYAALSANAKVFVDKIKRGQESYIIFAPVARKTSYTYQPPSASSAGKRQTPTGFPALPAGFVWLKTADRSTRTGTKGKWERTEEWTGADAWDTDVYAAVS